MAKKRPRGRLPKSVSFPKWCTPDQIRRALALLEREPHRDVQDLIMTFALEGEASTVVTAG